MFKNHFQFPNRFHKTYFPIAKISTYIFIISSSSSSSIVVVTVAVIVIVAFYLCENLLTTDTVKLAGTK
jgi:hypothetical protein